MGFGDIEKVSASLSTFKPLPPPPGQTYEPANDSAVLSVRFQNGAHGTIYVSRVVHLGNWKQYISVNGDKGILELSYSEQKINTIWGAQTHEDKITKLAPLKHLYEGIDQTKTGLDLFMELLTKQPLGDRLFVDSIYNDEPAKPDFYDCLKAQRVVDAAFEADRTGKWVSIKDGT